MVTVIAIRDNLMYTRERALNLYVLLLSGLEH